MTNEKYLLGVEEGIAFAVLHFLEFLPLEIHLDVVKETKEYLIEQYNNGKRK